MAGALRQRRRVLLLGMGGSHAVNRMVEGEYRALGIQAFAVTLSEQLYSPLDLQDAVVIVTSQSGESAEVHRILAELGGHPAAYGMTLEPNSALARALPSLVGAGGTEHAFAATRSLMITLALHLGVLAALGLDPTAALDALRTRPRLDVAEAAKLLKRCSAIVYSARALRGLAEAVALSTMELARMPAYALEGGQFRHGPLEILGQELGAVKIASRPTGSATRTSSPVEMTAATNDPMAAVARAARACPRLAISWPSIAVATEADSPGVFSRIEVVEPPYMPP
jgi:fructoselysine-6-P-deglycase FrlB-like protein